MLTKTSWEGFLRHCPYVGSTLRISSWRLDSGQALQESVRLATTDAHTEPFIPDALDRGDLAGITVASPRLAFILSFMGLSCLFLYPDLQGLLVLTRAPLTAPFW